MGIDRQPTDKKQIRVKWVYKTKYKLNGESGEIDHLKQGWRIKTTRKNQLFIILKYLLMLQG
jgi:hypothetical protein